MVAFPSKDFVWSRHLQDNSALVIPTTSPSRKQTREVRNSSEFVREMRVEGGGRAGGFIVRVIVTIPKGVQLFQRWTAKFSFQNP